ncbi:NAD-dependent epimerase/dehydratase family protein [Shewanella insulae]|uniref:NAD-dependent epimerase/dehydratase family protein n=1 Tax=Shewanella insulae TaxID=2681496 RepID=UPI001EFD858A|nr:NAD-dependent epimerase/dehydratase family protein [Shewanella insulae]MCG9714974.1 NAD-dependent epimerase/dehydratase family protein [Shewanella insulae]
MILVTGSTGFIGQYVIELLVESGLDFRQAHRKVTNLYFSNTIEVGDYSPVTNWDKALQGVDSIIHLAAIAHNKDYNLEQYQSVNNHAVIQLAKSASKNGVKRFIFVSSIGVNGMSTTDLPFQFDSQLHPHNHYSQSKYEAEIGLKKVAIETGLEVVIVRPTLVYGRKAPGNFGMLTKFIDKFQVTPFGLANNKRDFISVQNLADLLVTCVLHKDAAGNTFLASDGHSVSIKEFTNAIANGLGKHVIHLPIPEFLMRLAGKLSGRSLMIEQLFGNLEVDSSNAKTVLGWTPPLTMEQAMASLRESDK